MVLFNSLCEGDHLNIPRNMYTLINRSDSDSGALSALEAADFNHNALCAIDKYTEMGEGHAFTVYDDVWAETNALSMSLIAKNNNKINLISDIGDEGVDKIRFLYHDKNIVINNPSEDNMVIVWNKLDGNQKIKMLKVLKNGAYSFTIYNFLDDFNRAESEMSKYFEDESKSFLEIVSQYITGYSYFNYFRHVVVNKIGARNE